MKNTDLISLMSYSTDTTIVEFIDLKVDSKLNLSI